jgi:hypothetical protein
MAQCLILTGGGGELRTQIIGIIDDESSAEENGYQNISVEPSFKCFDFIEITKLCMEFRLK